MKDTVRLFIDKWGQTIVFALLTVLIVAKLSALSSESRTAAAIVRLDENYQNIWSSIRAGNAAK